MREFAQTAEAIAQTTKKLEKVALLAEYLKRTPHEEAARAAVFFSGRPFAAWEEATLQVGGSLLWRTVAELAGRDEHQLGEAYRQHGDLGAVAAAVLPERASAPSGAPSLSTVEIQAIFRQIAAARRATRKAELVRQLLSEVSPLEAKYVVKIMTGDLRIGLKESLVEEAVAKAYDARLAQIQRANMLLGDIGEPEVGRPRAAGSGPNENVPSHWLHAGEPSRIGRGRFELFRKRLGGRQIRRHSSAGSLLG